MSRPMKKTIALALALCGILAAKDKPREVPIAFVKGQWSPADGGRNGGYGAAGEYPYRVTTEWLVVYTPVGHQPWNSGDTCPSYSACVEKPFKSAKAATRWMHAHNGKDIHVVETIIRGTVLERYAGKMP